MQYLASQNENNITLPDTKQSHQTTDLDNFDSINIEAPAESSIKIEDLTEEPIDEESNAKVQSVEDKIINDKTYAEDAIGEKDNDLVTEEIYTSRIQGSFDIVRVDRLGTSVLAGRAESNSKILIYNDQVIIGEGFSDNNGQWVITIDEEIPNEILNLRISSQNDIHTEELFSEQVVTIMPNIEIVESLDEDVIDEVILLTETDEASKILSDDPYFLQDERRVNLRTIDYTEENLILGGQADADTNVNAYINNEYMGTAKSDSTGRWILNIEENIIPGDYEIRADMVDDANIVIARTETKFSRLSFANTNDAFNLNTITIKSGDNLWNIAQNTYGAGLQYTVLYLANTNQIVDPDLIFPGQVLMVPGS
tara:strand:- start:7102 stop:8205 length:1104 start_codon:yes stop_codon:yes gene_type:complete